MIYAWLMRKSANRKAKASQERDDDSYEDPAFSDYRL